MNQIMGRIDPLLKTLQVRPSPAEGLVQAYLIHIGDRSDANFRKILDLKGVRKQDQAHLVEMFVIHRDSPAAQDRQLVQSSPLLTPLLASGGGTGVGGSTGPSTGAGAAGRFDASTLGGMLLSAARDGVGVTGLSGATGASTPVGQGEKATINENLKNIGMFFRRDIGGLGARFGKRDVTPTGMKDAER